MGEQVAYGEGYTCLFIVNTSLSVPPGMKNFDCRAAILWLHMDVAAVGSLFIWGKCCWLIYNERNLKGSSWCLFPQSDKLLLKDKQLHWIKRICLFVTVKI